MRGKFIALEGVDFTGKTTQVKKASGFLSSLEVSHIVTREPGGTKLGEALRSLIFETEICKEAAILLFMSSRAENISKIIMPALEGGKHVICDRFIASTLAYQGVLSGFKREDILNAHKNFNFNIFPDLTIILDANPKALQERKIAAQDSRKANKFDLLPLETFTNLREEFLNSAKIKELNAEIINAERSEEEVFFEIKSLISKVLNL